MLQGWTRELEKSVDVFTIPVPEFNVLCWIVILPDVENNLVLLNDAVLRGLTVLLLSLITGD